MYVVNNDSALPKNTNRQSNHQHDEVSEKDLIDFSNLVEKEHAFYQKMGMQFFKEILV